jgi:hypothetical protein
MAPEAWLEGTKAASAISCAQGSRTEQLAIGDPAPASLQAAIIRSLAACVPHPFAGSKIAHDSWAEQPLFAGESRSCQWNNDRITVDNNRLDHIDISSAPRCGTSGHFGAPVW